MPRKATEHPARHRSAALLGVWSLEFCWSLEFGVWIFHFALLNHCPKNVSAIAIISAIITIGSQNSAPLRSRCT